jgi:hypothetical protein
MVFLFACIICLGVAIIIAIMTIIDAIHTKQFGDLKGYFSGVIIPSILLIIVDLLLALYNYSRYLKS